MSPSDVRSIDTVAKDAEVLAAHLDTVARRECASVLAAIREVYRPPEPLEAIVIGAFRLGAGWAFNLDAELGDVASLEDIANG
jgi:hypothetical protein